MQVNFRVPVNALPGTLTFSPQVVLPSSYVLAADNNYVTIAVK